MGQAVSSPTLVQQTPPHPAAASSAAAPPPGCPMHASTSSTAPAPPPEPKQAQCPISHDSSALNPHNQMPTLSQSPSSNQAVVLPTARTISSIRRPIDASYDGADPVDADASTSSKWEYPSPQQFYNALVRKGWETPEEHIVTMVDIHNFLNEEAWAEVVKWESKEEGGPADAANLELARFKGRPGELSPKARIFQLAGWLLPSRFNSEAPFDRHDWVVRRPRTNEEVRYVIDYYSAPDNPDGSPVFHLDVRPALDSFGSLKSRIAAATNEAWSAAREPGPDLSKGGQGKI